MVFSVLSDQVLQEPTVVKTGIKANKRFSQFCSKKAGSLLKDASLPMDAPLYKSVYRAMERQKEWRKITLLVTVVNTSIYVSMSCGVWYWFFFITRLDNIQSLQIDSQLFLINCEKKGTKFSCFCFQRVWKCFMGNTAGNAEGRGLLWVHCH